MKYRVVLLILCAGMLLVGTASAWYDYDWKYRKEITINNTGANLTNYQMMFAVNRGAGSDSGFTVYLDGKCESDYDDIRFTTSDGNTLCDYWIESKSSTVANIWVEIPSIPNSTAYGSTKVYLYYGNSAATAASNGDATFIFFDHFEGSSLNTSTWTTSISGETGSVTVSGSAAALYHYSSSGNPHHTRITSINTFSMPMVLESRYAVYVPNSGFKTIFKAPSIFNDVNYCVSHFNGHPNDGSAYANYGIGKGQIVWGTGAWMGWRAALITGPDLRSTNVIYHRDSIHLAQSNYKWYLDGTLRGTSSDSLNVTNGAIVASVTTWDTGIKGTLYIDFIFIRVYAATEPTVSAWGIEEGAPTPTPTPTPTGTPPIQGEIPQARIPVLGFMVLAWIDLGLMLYTFIDNENRNYMHVYSAVIAVILSFFLSVSLTNGFITEPHVLTDQSVTVNSSVMSTYLVKHVEIVDTGLSWFFGFIGVMMLIICILAVIEAVRENTEEVI